MLQPVYTTLELQACNPYLLWKLQVRIGQQAPVWLQADTGSVPVVATVDTCVQYNVSDADSIHQPCISTGATQLQPGLVQQSALNVTGDMWYGGGAWVQGPIGATSVALLNLTQATTHDSPYVESFNYLAVTRSLGTSWSSYIGSCAADGNLGLSMDFYNYTFRNASTEATASLHKWFPTWAADTGVPSVLALHLCLQNPVLQLGGYSLGNTTSAIHFTEVNKTSSVAMTTQAVDVQQIQIGDEVLTDASLPAAVDSGSPANGLPLFLAQRMAVQLQNNLAFQQHFGSVPSAWFVWVGHNNPLPGPSPAVLNAQLPPLRVTLLSDVTGEPYTLQLQAVPGYLQLASTPAANSELYHYSYGMESLDSSYAILGAGAMMQLVVVLDSDRGRIGFAQQPAVCFTPPTWSAPAQSHRAYSWWSAIVGLLISAYVLR